MLWITILWVPLNIWGESCLPLSDPFGTWNQLQDVFLIVRVKFPPTILHCKHLSTFTKTNKRKDVLYCMVSVDATLYIRVTKRDGTQNVPNFTTVYSLTKMLQSPSWECHEKVISQRQVNKNLSLWGEKTKSFKNIAQIDVHSFIWEKDMMYVPLS